ncbi:insulin-like growth factor 2 mRNA-binding protein 2 isoform X2 [Patiria miniata]|uniref:RRM domain-containing protein n=1 Tax=Patiria miniata TaxID=46514 RepID=A0A913YYV1_PATMI|nr:insulin-like growth factor 2 mRNA-binding protein 2 isoform X2 [Patiria miniata]
MNKIYCGNLSEDVTEDALRDLFEENGVPVSSMVVKRSANPNSNASPFAFVDVENEEMAQLAIDKLNDYNLLGSVMVVEHSVPKRGRGNRSRSTNIQVHNIPLNTPLQEIQDLLKTFGEVSSCEKGREGANGYGVNATYAAVEQAQQAIKQLNNYEFNKSMLKVNYKTSGSRQGNRYNRNPNRNQGNAVFPVRMLVPSDTVGAIIGRGGKTIKQITAETEARIDIHRHENPGSGEKAVTYFGNPEDCTTACRKVREVLSQELSQKGSLPPLKLLAHDALVGRLIGKGGSSLKHIMQESGATITISPLHELTVCNPERTITIKGTLDQESKAESLITAKLRTAYEQHMQSMQNQQQQMFPGINHMAMFSGGGEHNHGGYQNQGMGQGPIPGLYYPNPRGYRDQRMQQEYPRDANETTFLYVPNEAVGAIIGVKGDIIKSMCHTSNASIRIAPAENQIAQRENEAATERKVTIIGSPESQWKAQLRLFEKVCGQGHFETKEEHLRCEIGVPAKMVGRIIGKKGTKVRDLQRATFARIEVPRANKEEEDAEQNPDDSEAEVMVKIYGNFFSLQAAQRRLRKMLFDFTNRGNQNQYNNYNQGGYNQGGYQRRGRMNGPGPQ